MVKHSFLDDYSEGCHPAILDALAGTNRVQQTAYGDDEYSQQARALLRTQVRDPDAAVHFVASGTLANIISIASCLRPHEAVIAAGSGHIVVRETGAIEATGHKIITMPPENGKLTVQLVESALAANAHFPHMARPRLVYISNASEVGTLYTKAELSALSELCRRSGLLLFLDGARLGAALAADGNDLSLADICELTDLFWIGGTKVGALFGEAIVIGNRDLAEDFRFHLKQRGALLAKGRFLGLQFRELFDGSLFFDLARHANAMAARLSAGILDSGYSMAAPTETNQVFPILPDILIDEMKQRFDFYVWEKQENGRSVVRLVTSWATEAERVEDFLESVRSATGR